MKALGLKFRVDDLTATPRAVTGVLSQAVLDETLPGLIGKLGYRPEGDAAIDAEDGFRERGKHLDQTREADGERT